MDTLTLIAAFQPAGDQPQAIEALVEGIDSGVKHQTLLGVTGAGNLTVFEEVYRILKRCWAAATFSYEGEFSKVPVPYAGCPWPAVEMTTTRGAPGKEAMSQVLITC